jgi:hypothetical protein
MDGTEVEVTADYLDVLSSVVLNKLRKVHRHNRCEEMDSLSYKRKAAPKTLPENGDELLKFHGNR